MTKKIAILGSTGSIGINTLKVISALKGRYEVTALSAGSNISELAIQARKFRPRIIAVGSSTLARKIRTLLPPGTKVVAGADGLCEIASRKDLDVVVFAISGTACLVPLVEAIKNKKRIALANKESLVAGGDIVMDLAKKNNVKIIPIDSEHSAIFQCLDGKREFLSKIYLTGSGGPLLDVPKARFDCLSKGFILKHPKWNMGEKISVDSATMMNKGLEIIEAEHLFGVSEGSIEVLIHPEAIVHSMVEFIDGSVLAQMGVPDMKLPIQYALTYPERTESFLKRVDFTKVGNLSFRRPDTNKFPCLELARYAAKRKGTYPAVLCAADEETVKGYLNGSIRFSDIPKIIEKVLKRNSSVKEPGLPAILQAGEWAKKEARSLCYH